MAVSSYSSYPPTGLCAEWAHTGSRRTLANYPTFVDAKSGEIVITERDNHRIQIFSSLGEETRFEPFGSKGHSYNQFLHPGGVTTTPTLGAQIIVADTGNRRVSTFRLGTNDEGYGIVQHTDSFGNQIFAEPTGVEFDPWTSHVVVTDPGKSRVTIHDLRSGQCIGETQPVPECPLVAPHDVTLDQRGRLYVTDAYQHKVYIFDSNGQIIKVFGGPGYDPGQFNKPSGICFDRDFNLLIADEGNNRIQMFTAQGEFIGVVTKDVHVPKGISVNVHDDLVIATGDPYNFLKILKYK